MITTASTTIAVIIIGGILVALGAPLFIALGAIAYILLTSVNLDTQTIAIEMYRITSSPNLIVIPMFAFAGVVMAKSNMSKRFVALAQALIGWLPGSPAIISLLTFELFTAFTGASGISILAAGGMLYSILVGSGYSDKFSIGLISSAGSLGVLLPPSIVIIFYGTLTRTPILQLFQAGILPSLVMFFLLAIYCIWVGKGLKTRIPFSLEKCKKALWDAKYELPLGPCIVGGIYTGYLSINDAACFTAVYVSIIESFFYKEVSFVKDLPKMMVDASKLVGAIFVVLGVSLGITNYFVDQEIPLQVMEWANSWISTPTAFLISLNILLLIIGCCLDVFSALILLVPLITPLAMQYGIHPLHLGIIFLANLEIGYSAPPAGLNLFLAALAFKRPSIEIARAVIPFVLILILSVIIITFVPWLSTWFVE